MMTIPKRHQHLKPLAFSIALLFALAFSMTPALAQDTLHISLQQAVRQGLDSSKTLHISQSEIDAAMARFQQARDARLPDIKAGFTGSEAFIFTRTFQVKGLMKEPLTLPDKATMYMGTLSANQAIFAGNQLRLASQSAALLHKIAQLNTESDSEQVTFDVIDAYITLFKIDENLKIMDQELLDIQGRLDETIQFKDQGLATDNDVLRFKLQKARAELSQIDLENSRAVANYALCILLGQPEGLFLKVDSINDQQSELPALNDLMSKALLERKEINVYQYRSQLSDLNIKKINGEKLPTLGVGITGYYINPNSQFFPPQNSFIVPAMVGLNLSWHISSLYTSKHKIAEAKIQRDEVKIAQQATIDQVKIDVNKQYHDYLQSLKKIQVLHTAVEQAQENDRIMELKYKNQLATTTDRIDAQTMLYQSLTNLSIARAEAVTAYYQLLRATGTLNEKTAF